jgi:hypothetical protein
MPADTPDGVSRQSPDSAGHCSGARGLIPTKSARGHDAGRLYPRDRSRPSLIPRGDPAESSHCPTMGVESSPLGEGRLLPLPADPRLIQRFKMTAQNHPGVRSETAILPPSNRKSGRVDLNHRPHGPEPCALIQTELRPDCQCSEYSTAGERVQVIKEQNL